MFVARAVGDDQNDEKLEYRVFHLIYYITCFSI
jgi:hypothetical protein